MPKQKRKLTDKMLLKAVTELGGADKAPELGDMLGFPERTIRYRLQRLKEKGYLDRIWPQTIDAKLGLGELGLFLVLTEEHRNIPREFLYCFKNLNILWATFGRYNGYFSAGGYPIDSPEIIDDLIHSLKRMNIITDWFRFNTVDFIPLSADLSRYNPKTGWTWDWKEWVEQSENAIKSGEPVGFDLVLDQGSMDYDHKDIAILAEIKEYGHISSKEISRRVGLSDTQVRARIRRLRDENVLKESIWLIPPTPNSMVMYTFVELDTPDDPALSCFRYLPFRKEIYFDKPNKYAVRINMNSSDLVYYMLAFEKLRTHFNTYFFQIVVNPTSIPEGRHSLYKLYNESTGRWEMPMDEYIRNLERFIEQLKL
ncbi:MAG: winged helix-turn-helix transcriptional regulator [Candidatus Thorarchaeota archaeon]